MECDGPYEPQREFILSHIAHLRALIDEIRYRTGENIRALERFEETEQSLALALYQLKEPPF